LPRNCQEVVPCGFLLDRIGLSRKEAPQDVTQIGTVVSECRYRASATYVESFLTLAKKVYGKGLLS
jgi:hypothetical protein